MSLVHSQPGCCDTKSYIVIMFSMDTAMSIATLMPSLAQMSMKDLGHVFENFVETYTGINIRDNSAAARSFEDRFKVPYPSLEDPNGQLLLAFRDVIPTSVVPSTVVSTAAVTSRPASSDRSPTPR